MHETPTDIGAVPRDYVRDMVLPALEIYTEGLVVDRTMYDAFLAADDRGEAHAPHNSDNAAPIEIRGLKKNFAEAPSSPCA